MWVFFSSYPAPGLIIREWLCFASGRLTFLPLETTAIQQNARFLHKSRTLSVFERGIACSA